VPATVAVRRLAARLFQIAGSKDWIEVKQQRAVMQQGPAAAVLRVTRHLAAVK
jgi:hypothetical protein